MSDTKQLTPLDAAKACVSEAIKALDPKVDAALVVQLESAHAYLRARNFRQAGALIQRVQRRFVNRSRPQCDLCCSEALRHMEGKFDVLDFAPATEVEPAAEPAPPPPTTTPTPSSIDLIDDDADDDDFGS